VLHYLRYERQLDIRILPMYPATVTHRRWLWPVKFAQEALERAVALKVGIPGLSHSATGKSRIE
jgi:hypothetical protein